jgi:hypothetical protein
MRTLTKKPLQVYLDVDQEQALRSLSQRLQVSMAELIRRSVNLFLAELPVEEDPAMRIVGLGRSGIGDLARNHDKYLVEFERESNRA